MYKIGCRRRSPVGRVGFQSPSGPGIQHDDCRLSCHVDGRRRSPVGSVGLQSPSGPGIRHDDCRLSCHVKFFVVEPLQLSLSRDDLNSFNLCSVPARLESGIRATFPFLAHL